MANGKKCTQAKTPKWQNRMAGEFAFVANVSCRTANDPLIYVFFGRVYGLHVLELLQKDIIWYFKKKKHHYGLLLEILF